ncbi:hypothetical protein J3459_011526 [Metarhizium acridum]|uniref:uncharacterized protein n=1 Tax=Metarhizium acridum TaxID=92637 RepID=UPI001C6B1245|nr:hypothetical protein J3458_022076 [Metarhizium acridum]KAG8418907.1 hypothetical protein J3459_011888 [Metarhizium acridum]KAG8419120.1 hypothetical protein J3459_011526 [Metarhizium acridum]
MQTSIIAIALVSLKGTMAGYAEVCLDKAQGCIDYRVTKDCCAAVGGQQHFEESSHICISNNLCGGNGVNIGAMVDCCEGRGAGSRELGYDGLCSVNELPPRC